MAKEITELTESEQKTFLRSIGVESSRITLPSQINATVGKTLQIFRTGVVEHPEQDSLDVRFSASAVGKQYRRFYEFTPSEAGSVPLAVTASDSRGSQIATGSSSIVASEAVGSPEAATRVLFIGDSIIAAGTGPTEFLRMLTGTDGTPVGLEFTNIELIGTQGSDPNYHEGRSGWSASQFVQSGSPFYIGGQLDFAAYVADNTLGGLECVYIMLGWNGLVKDRPLASDHSALRASIESLIDAILADYPDCKIGLLGLYPPEPDGIGDDYYDASANLGSYYGVLRSVHGVNLMYKEIAEDADYASNVQYLGFACQFDPDNNYPTESVAVNARNANTEARGSNGIHPASSGHYQLADVAFNHFVRYFCQSAEPVELLTNGSFDSDVTGWTTYITTLTYSSGKARCTNSTGGASNTGLYQAIATASSHVRVTGDFTKVSGTVSGNVSVRNLTTGTVANTGINDTGSFDVTVAMNGTGSNLAIYVYTQNGAIVEFDNLSCVNTESP